MSEAPSARQLQCRNRWHYQPGPILACPVCGMTASQLKDNPAPAPTERAQYPRAEQQQEARGHRVQIKHFKNADPDVCIREANEWLNKMSGDPRTQIAEQIQMFSHNGTFVVAVFYATAI